MRISPINPNYSFTGTLKLNDTYGNEHSINTKDIKTIKTGTSSKGWEEGIIIEQNNGAQICVDTPSSGVETYNKVLSAYTAACQNDNVTIQLPETTEFYVGI